MAKESVQPFPQITTGKHRVLFAIVGKPFLQPPQIGDEKRCKSSDMAAIIIWYVGENRNIQPLLVYA
jgi:hypothetical protein